MCQEVYNFLLQWEINISLEDNYFPRLIESDSSFYVSSLGNQFLLSEAASTEILNNSHANYAG